MKKSTIIQFTVSVVGVFLVLMVGFMVMDNVGDEINYLKGYCQDKHGLINISDLNLTFYEDDFINCTRCNEDGCFDSSIAVM